MKAYYHKRDENQITFEELSTHACTSEELGLDEGTSLFFEPTFKDSATLLDKYANGMVCFDD